MKTVILVPAFETVPTLFCQSLTGLEKPEGTEIIYAIGSLVYDARNQLADAAIDGGFDFAFWTDSDMVFEKDLLFKMFEVMKESDAPMVSTVCRRRKPPHTYVQYSSLEEKDGVWDAVAIEEPKGTMEIEACGFGGVLIQVPLMKAVRDVWGRPFNPIDGIGEDLSFCVRAKMLGAKIVCDESLRMGHMGQAIY